MRACVYTRPTVRRRFRNEETDDLVHRIYVVLCHRARWPIALEVSNRVDRVCECEPS